MNNRDPLQEASEIRARTSAIRWAPPGGLAGPALSLPPGGPWDDGLWVARWVARMAMVGGHGCTGKGCRKRGHRRDREVMHLVLAVLGLGGHADPSGHLNELGRRKYPASRDKPGLPAS